MDFAEDAVIFVQKAQICLMLSWRRFKVKLVEEWSYSETNAAFIRLTLNPNPEILNMNYDVYELARQNSAAVCAFINYLKKI